MSSSLSRKSCGVFRHVGELDIPWQRILDRLQGHSSGSHRVVTHVQRHANRFHIRVDVQDEFMVFSGNYTLGAARPERYMSQVWSDEVHVTRVPAPYGLPQSHSFLAEGPQQANHFQLNVAAIVDSDEVRSAQYVIRCTASEARVYF